MAVILQIYSPCPFMDFNKQGKSINETVETCYQINSGRFIKDDK